MKERQSKNPKETQKFNFKSVQLYVKNYAANCRQSYLRLLSI